MAAGLGEFAAAVGPRKAERVLAPSQWEEGVRAQPDVGPRSVDALRALRFRLASQLVAGLGAGRVEYPAAQAYAATVIALHCLEEAGSPDDVALLGIARRLRCTTFFGRFGLGPEGRQPDHRLLVVQWQGGVKRIVGPPEVADADLRR